MRQKILVLATCLFLPSCSDTSDRKVAEPLPTLLPEDLGGGATDMGLAVQDMARVPDAGAGVPDEGVLDQGSSDDQGLMEDQGVGQDAQMDAGQTSRCVAGKPWSLDQKAFEVWGKQDALTGLGVTGRRISAVDLDGDGWTDLVIRSASNKAVTHGFGPQDPKHVWVLRNKGDGTFEDITQGSGLLARRDGRVDVGRPAEIWAFGDVDNDGDLDGYSTFSNSDQAMLSQESAEIMLNQGDGTFALGPLEHDLRVKGSSVRGGASFVDTDRDGALDVWVGAGGPGQDELYAGDGKGAFGRVTGARGLTTKSWRSAAEVNSAQGHTNSWAVGACDLNNDGLAELTSASYSRAPNHLWLAQQQGGGGELRYLNRSIGSGYAFDANQDWSDNESARCHCKLNPQDQGCAGVPAPAYILCQSQQNAFRWDHQFDQEAYRLGGNSGTTVCADLNNDGWMDLLTTEIVHWDVGGSSDRSEILYNTKDPLVRFERPGREQTGLTRTHSGVSWDEGDITAAAFDFDNDGRLDLYIGSTDYAGTRGLLYHQRPDATFEPVPLAVGIDHTSSHGLGVADFDRDGDLDLIVGHSRSRCSTGSHCYPSAHVRLFENLAGHHNNWVQLELVGASGSNRSAIGARIEVEAGPLKQTHEISGGHGHYGIQHDLVAHFGLADQCEATVLITWPDQARTSQRVTLEAGRRWRIVQGQEPVALEAK